MSASSHAERRASLPSRVQGRVPGTSAVIHLYRANRSAPWVFCYTYDDKPPQLPVRHWFRLSDQLRHNESVQADAITILAFVLGDDNAGSVRVLPETVPLLLGLTDDVRLSVDVRG